MPSRDSILGVRSCPIHGDRHLVTVVISYCASCRGARRSKRKAAAALDNLERANIAKAVKRLTKEVIGRLTPRLPTFDEPDMDLGKLLRRGRQIGKL